MVVLGDRELSGGIRALAWPCESSGTAYRALELPFSVVDKEAGVDEDGDAVTAPPVSRLAGYCSSGQGGQAVDTLIRILRRVLSSALEGGSTCSPSLTAR